MVGKGLSGINNVNVYVAFFKIINIRIVSRPAKTIHVMDRLTAIGNGKLI